MADSLDENVMPYMESCHAFMDKGNVLVHCNAGVSRSGAIVVSYVMKNKGLSYDDALAFLREKRKKVTPNTAFEKQLREWEP